MANDRSQKVVVVTASSKGIGKAIAVEFAKEGYNIVLMQETRRNSLKQQMI
jgi:3-oxoacyl-[acyl-carrier protein] reductase